MRFFPWMSNSSLFMLIVQVIRQYRAGRTIILTTHFMDEADLLSDRIAIMAEGRLRCVGSSMFLKKTYGVGYQLTIEKAARQNNFVIEQDIVDLQSNWNGANGAVGGIVADASETIDETLCAIVSGAVREAQLLSNVGTEMSFQLPLGATSTFKPMFEALDTEVERGAIETYGVSITTLEEVFLLVARGTDNKSKKILPSSRETPATLALHANSDRSKMDLEMKQLFFTHLRALFKKRAINFKRDKKAWCCTTILPSLFVLIGFLIFAFASPNRDLVAVKLDLADYNVNVMTGPRNPIPSNANGTVFTCQPGSCTYPVTSLDIGVTGESYQFCGTQARLNGSSCTISHSQLFEKFAVAGMFPIPQNGSDIESVRSDFNI